MQNKHDFVWKELNQIPDGDGFAGSYAGISGGALIVAGGANFPGDKRPWTKGIKTWHNKIFVLEEPNGKWKLIGLLPRPMGYGVSLSYKGSLICIGGGDAQNNYTDVMKLTYSNQNIDLQMLPSLPVGLANACGTISNDRLYVMGGIKTPAGLTENVFFGLDLSANDRAWQILEPLPGASRMLATAGSLNGKVYLFGGVHLYREDSAIKRIYLKDCWVYESGKNWKRIADLPQPLAAAPSPAFVDKKNLILIGGDDGSLANQVMELKDNHPGFRSEILSYNSELDNWTEIGKFPCEIKKDAATNPHESIYAPVTTPLLDWQGNLVIAGGEVRPAVRTKRVFMATRQ